VCFLLLILTAPRRLGSRSAMLGLDLCATALARTGVTPERALDDWMVGMAAKVPASVAKNP
jgi:hypothetical protein